MAKKRPDLHLGATQSGKRIYLDADARKTHMHVIGASGKGKSYFLEFMIRQDIRNGDGLCLIDPHGTLYHKVVAWCAQHPKVVSRDKLILLDASAPGWSFGFNPLGFGSTNTSFAVDKMLHAIAQVWGGEDTASTPLLKKVLRGVLHALAEKNLTLVEAQYLVNDLQETRALREHITNDIMDSVMRHQWEQWNELTPHAFREQFSSTTNRLMEFLSAEVIRAIIGQQQWVMDFRKAMDEGAVVLVNLEPRGVLSDDNARMLGTLITHELFMKAQERPEGSRPFYFYIDECGQYLNESIQRMLDESRKRGLHLILANQHLSQLRKAGDTVYSAVMTDAQTKVIFGGLNDEDTESMVKEVFLDLDLEEPKKSLTRRVAVGQEQIILRSGSSGTSTSKGRARMEAESHGRNSGTSSGASSGESQYLLDDGTQGPITGAWGIQDGAMEGESSGTSSAVTESETESVTSMSGWTESFKTIYADAVGGVYTLEEQRYKKKAWLKKQPRQMALLVTPDLHPIPFRAADVSPARSTKDMQERLVKERFNALPFVQRTHDANMLIEERTLALKEQAGAPHVPEHAEIDYLDNG